MPGMAISVRPGGSEIKYNLLDRVGFVLTG